MSAVKLEASLNEVWGRIHCASGVKVIGVRSFPAVKWNTLHDVYKHADGIDRFKMRVLKSNGWIRPGWDALEPVLKKWALSHSGGKGMQVVWQIHKDYIYRWCVGERIVLVMSANEVWVAEGTKI